MQLRFERKVDSDWHHVHTCEISQEDKESLLRYIATHPPVKGFYRYKFDGFEYDTCVTFLLDYIKAMKL